MIFKVKFMVLNFLKKRYKYLLLLLLFLSIWGISAVSHWGAENVGANYYKLLSDAFLKGQLSLLVQPAPELLKLANPYDPIQNLPYRLHDASLYKGKYYLYWGPFPAIMRIISAQQFDQDFMIVLYIFLASFFFYKIAALIREKYFKNISDFLFYSICAAGIFNGMSIYMLTVSGIYYEAIVASMAFSSAGLYFFLKSIEEDSASSSLFLCGLFFSFAVASRVSSIFVLAPVMLFYLIQFFYKKDRGNEVKKMSYFALPLLATAVLLLLYHYLRFENVFEFGITYQLVGLSRDRQNIVQGTVLSFQNSWKNIYQYLFAIPHFIDHAPFLDIDRAPHIERIVWSAFVISPLSLFLFGVFSIRKKLPNDLKYFLFTVALAAFLTLFFFSFLVAVTPRYMTDFIYLFNVVGAVFLLYLFNRFHSEEKRFMEYFLMITMLLFILEINFPLFLYGLAEYNPVQYQHFLNLIG